MPNANGSKWIRKAKRLAIYRRDSFTCVYCGASVADGAALSLDHVQPRELGGGNEASNLVTACISCNSARRMLPVAEFAMTLADRGVDPLQVARNVRNATRRDWRLYR